MKLHLKTWTLGATLPLALAVTAAAQTYSLPGGYNPLIGLPTVLPGPVNSPISGSISLPAPILTPTLIAPGVKIEVPLLPVALAPTLPAVRAVANKENVAHPLAKLFPLKTTLSATAKKDEGKKADKLDELFDGTGKKERPVVDLPAEDYETTRPARRISLPEWDLEREIGAF